MSIQAVAWAIEQDQDLETNTKFVLLCVANYAGEDGRNAFPSISTLSRHTKLSERTVRRSLRTLELSGYIVRGNQSIAAAYIERADRRPTVYDLPLSRGASVTPRGTSGGPIRAERGANDDRTGGQALAPDPNLRKPLRNPGTIVSPKWGEPIRNVVAGLASAKRVKR